MKILLSGASSFTGYWFGKTLAEAGHQVTGLFRGDSSDEYDGLRAVRVRAFQEVAEGVFGCTFGENRFLEVVASGKWDVYCHHASDVANYRSPDFDPIGATQSNTHNLGSVLETLQKTGCSRVMITGTVFEQGEGQGSDQLPAISRYGLSKTLSWQVWLHEGLEREFQIGKFVIPNPFGPLEELKFTAYLANTWKSGKLAECRTPLYIRDNIPVDLLALEYRRFLEHQPEGVGKCYPSGYVESQGAFTERMAREFRARTGRPCGVATITQSDFSEPMIRINTQSSRRRHPDWDEAASWDRFAEHHA